MGAFVQRLGGGRRTWTLTVSLCIRPSRGCRWWGSVSLAAASATWLITLSVIIPTRKIASAFSGLGSWARRRRSKAGLRIEVDRFVLADGQPGRLRGVLLRQAPAERETPHDFTDAGHEAFGREKRLSARENFPQRRLSLLVPHRLRDLCRRFFTAAV